MKKQNHILTFCVIALVGISIAVTGFIWKQSFLRILPLFVSLVIAYLQSKANRYASLLGSINSLFYAAVYGYYHLYASMVYAIVISCPIQFVTFLQWQKNRWKGTTRFRSMTWKQRGLLSVGVAAIWLGMLILLKTIGSGYSLLDDTITMFGILISFLTMFAFIEYAVLMIPSAAVSIILYTVMLKENPEQITYLIFSVYCFVCQCIAFFNVRRAYREQQLSNITDEME